MKSLYNRVTEIYKDPYSIKEFYESPRPEFDYASVKYMIEDGREDEVLKWFLENKIRDWTLMDNKKS